MGEWENIEIERIRRLAEAMGWVLIMSELVADKINVKMERKIPMEVLEARREIERREGIPT